MALHTENSNIMNINDSDSDSGCDQPTEMMDPATSKSKAPLCRGMERLESYRAPSNADFRKDYRDAVDCLVHCDTIISALEAKLAAKDEELAEKDAQLADVHDDLVACKIALADARASEEETKHRLSKRLSVITSSSITVPEESSDIIGNGASSEEEEFLLRSWTRHESDADHQDPPKRKQRWSISFGGNVNSNCPNDQDPPTLVESFTSSRGGMLDESYKTALNDSDTSKGNRMSSPNESASFRMGSAVNFGQLFWRRDSNKCVVDFEEKKVDNVTHTVPLKGGGRRNPSAKRMQRMQKSSRSFIDGVVFPESFDDVVNKGVMEVRKSLKQMLSADELRQIGVMEY